MSAVSSRCLNRLGRVPGPVRILIPGALLLLLISLSPAHSLNPDLAITQYVQNVWRAPQFLPHDDVASIVQSRDGYLWVGTVEGLARFDGVRSVVFDKSNTPAIANNWIRALLEDHEGRLWIGTFGGGLVCLQNGKFSRFGANEGLPGDVIYSLYEDAEGHVLIGTLGNGIFRFENGGIRREPGTESISSRNVRAILQDRNRVLWIGTEAGLYSLDHGRMTRYGRITGLSDDEILALQEDGDTLWIGTGKGGVCWMNHGKASSITMKEGLSHDRVWSLLVDKDHNVWIGTDGGGLNRWSGGRLSVFNTKSGLTNDYVWALREDREGSLWIGTNGGGLNRLKAGHVVTVATQEGLPSDFTWSVFRARAGALWVGTEDAGVARIDEGVITTFRVPDAPTANIKAMLERRDGTLWMGGNQGLDVFRDGRIVPANVPGVKDETVHALAEDADGTLWIGTERVGLMCLKGTSLQDFAKGDLPGTYITSLLIARDGSLWAGAVGGVSHRTGNGFVSFRAKDGLPSDYVTSLFQAPDGAIWAATRGGLARIAGNAIGVITSQDGLLDDAIMCAILGDDGNVWMGSNRGIFRASLRELEGVLSQRLEKVHCVAYGLDDGMKSVEVNNAGSSAWKDPDGRLWFATRSGVASIRPRERAEGLEPPQVLIEEVVADGKQIASPAPWILPAGTFSLDIHFTATSLRSPSALRFRYRLEGFDPGWTDSGPDRTAHYTNLPYGKYRFRVAAAAREGASSGKETETEIQVEPRPYETLWFRILAGIALLVAGPVFYMIRTRRLQSQKDELERLVAERTVQVQAANERLEQLAREDSLTGVANRRRLDEAIDEEWRRAYRTGTALAFLLIDVDFFKAYNDHLGHVAGDNCLKAVSGTVADVCRRAGELVARYGGEEFGVVLPVINRKGAETTAETIRRRVQELALPHPASVAPVVTVSVGMAWVYPREGGAVSDLIHAADRALYRAKAGGRNRVEIAS